ncbi:MAG: SGNH/GDSL hydrolase family protein [Butyrivibrio sp.]|nr:SGNH/GDSL hydrolase family protein [Acetatifactor muris]MCM1558901.1 SGNH/GDSL hydrolase family protein [Butyrivibrio sp.]
MINLNYEAAVANRGNQERIKSVFRRAKQGEKLTLGFLGGSITQGSLATNPKLCYAYRVYEWWCRTFPDAEFVYLNAGIGATDSQFGCARVDSDLLAYRPDFVIVEFSVNDSAAPHYLETYEGLVRRIYGAEWQPAVLLVHNVCYDNGGNAQLMHGKVARYYELPSVSMQSCIYPELVSGRLENRTITPDDLHPNDYGHELVASVITYFLDKILEDEGLTDKELTDRVSSDTEEREEPISLKKPLTANAYENSVRYRNDNASPVLQGFTPDPASQEVITDIFKKGWTATDQGASVTFEVEGSCIGVQYRKTMQLPAPVAELILDGDEDHPFVLDANFDETWGDKLALDTVLEHGEDKLHRVEIRLKETHEDDKLPFYLVSVIASSAVCLRKEGR